ncbi:hypothetical protein DFQ14_102466 [Halopolyspora algeriensis]|uniref:Glycosyltransferase A (GT-A) superfamily protein (DUF2064 family) n=1 Tax=Halopolyspora algeriensis TaxID=1500506 RepID=A0A368VWD9_9ACTN|nr:DUF2064 domain-containing protein [Halopolyspora algeriensis]RCW46163.1 hypothetical protein DFQ14_102466 [Halopolyspora algeriensis]TQM55566.1 hypothetical protein FHU43_0341 [Halopolyspora algeriensis]
MNSTAMLVVAKSPEPGRAKTRLSPPATPEQAAAIAAGSLLDTMRAVHAVAGGRAVVAWTGEPARAVRHDEIAAVLATTRIVRQRGEDFARRLAAAHADVAELMPQHPVLQIGMDTPQVTGALLERSAEPLHREGGPDAVLGPACDGGWWALGLRNPRWADVLGEVPMSRADTGDRTLEALRSAGLRVQLLPELSDVDTMAAARSVAARIPGSEFAAAVRAAASGGEGRAVMAESTTRSSGEADRPAGSVRRR